MNILKIFILLSNQPLPVPTQRKKFYRPSAVGLLHNTQYNFPEMHKYITSLKKILKINIIYKKKSVVVSDFTMFHNSK